MPLFNENVARMARENSDFRREVLTTDHCQVVLLCLQPGEETGEETHWASDQLYVTVEGIGAAVVGAELSPMHRNSVVAVPGGTTCNLRNIGRESLRLYHICAPPELEPGTVEPRREMAAGVA
jgi:mannose-6-phosphate isomerase-like protein (cupin superfamily)